MNVNFLIFRKGTIPKKIQKKGVNWMNFDFNTVLLIVIVVELALIYVRVRPPK